MEGVGGSAGFADRTAYSVGLESDGVLDDVDVGRLSESRWYVRWARVWIWLMLLGGVSGCAFVRANVGERLPEEAIQAIQKGVTTKAQVVEALGTPDVVTHTMQHEVFQYRYGDGKLGVVLIFSRATYKTDDLYIFFDAQDVVTDIIFGKRTDTVRFRFWPFGS